MENIKLVPKGEIGAIPSSHGFEYEAKVTLFTALTAALTFDDFEINTNVKNFEPLDDIFLKGYKNGEETSYLVQLKHVAKSAILEDSFFINKNDLNNKFQKKPKFDLIRYNSKYIDLSKKFNTDNVNFIFYTNYKLDVNSTLFLKNDNLDDMLINSLNTSAEQESFLLNKNSDKLQFLNEHFISNTYFLSNQENVDNIGNSILNLLTKFQINEDLSELIIGNLFHYFDTICSETENKPVITKSLTLKLVYFSCLYCRNITIFKLPNIDSHSVYSPYLWDYLKKNKLIIKKKHLDNIKSMIFNHDVSIQEENPIYMNILFKHKKIELKQIVKKYFVQCCCGFLPFLIESQYHQEIVDIVNNFKNFQVIFIDKNNDKYIESKFSGVSFELCDEIFKIKIRPSNRNECLIEDLFENKDELKLMLNNVNVSDFLDINENIQLEDKKEGIVLDRFVNTFEIENSLNDLIKDDVVVFINLDYLKSDLIRKFKLKISEDLINYVDETNVINSNSKIIVLNEDNYNKFNINIIKNKYKSKNVHFLNINASDDFIWINTFGILKHIKVEEASDDNKLQSIPKIYKYNELMVFSGIPGIGKSVAMNQLATFYPPNVYVLLIKLTEKQEILNKLTGNVNCLQILKLLSIETNTFYSNIFEQKFKQKDLCVILDGYDEVAPRFIKITNELIKCILREDIQVVLTTRSVLQNEIEKEFSTRSLILIPFDLEQQTQYLEQYFLQNSKLDEYDIKNVCADIVHKVENNLIGDIDFNSVPLHLKIICDLLLDLFKKNNFNVVDIKIDELKLYETFIAKKLEVFTEKTKELNFNEGEIIKYHQSFALKKIFPHFIDSTLQENINVFSQRIKSGSEKTGFLVDDVNEIFIHRTIAEYFTASWLVDNCENNKLCKKIIINEIFKKEYYFVHSCFNSLLYNNISVWNKIFSNKFNEIISDEINQIYPLNRNILHLVTLNLNINIKSKVISSSLEEFIKNNIHEIIKLKTQMDNFQLTPFDYLEKMIRTNQLVITIGELKNNFYFHFNQDFSFLEFLNCKNIKISNSKLKFKNGYELLMFAIDGVNLNKFNFIFLWENYDKTNNVRLLEDYKIGFEWLVARGEIVDDLYYKAMDINSIQLTTFLLEKYDHSSINMYYNPLSYDYSSNLIDYIKSFLENERVIKSNTPLMNRIRDHFIKYLIVNKNEQLVNNLLINNSGSSQITLFNQLREFPELLNIYRDFIIKEKIDKLGNTVIHLIILSKNDKNFTQNTFHNRNLLNLLKYVITIENNINSINIRSETPLHLAIKNNDLETIKILIKYKIDINYSGMFQDPYLHCSIKINNLEIMKLLLEHEANIEIKDNIRNTPLICAIRDKNLNAAKILLKIKANIDATNNLGDTPLIFAINSKNLELIKLLLNLGVKINTTNYYQSSPLSLAVEYNVETNIIKLLIDKGAYIENVDLAGNTPLLYAILAKNLETLKLLIQCGAKINVQNRKLESPLHIAVEENSLEIVKVLMENNAKLDVIDKKGKTPLSLALKIRNEDIIQLLKLSKK